MKTKTSLFDHFAALALATLLLPLGALSAATTNLATTLQQALFEEEANHNLPAAIQAYQSLILQFDQDRKLAATAVFRLGECYRKQGNTNDATAQYERIVRDFSDQTTLLALSRQNLAAFGAPTPAPAGSSFSSVARQQQKRFLEEEIKLAEKQLAASQKQVDVGQLAPDGLIPAQRDLLKLRRQLAALDAGQSPLNGTVGSDPLAEAERLRLENQIVELRKLSKEKLRVAVQQSNPNPVLSNLMQQLVLAEQRLATTSQEYGQEHTEVLKAKVLVETISKQLDAQVEGAMIALEAMRDSLAKVTLQEPRAPAESNLSTTAEAEEVKRIQALIKNSPDLINSSDKSGQTLLQTAAAKGETAIVKLLVDSGAAVDGVRQQDLTPLHCAAGNGHKAVVDLLLSRGAKADARTDTGVTPLHLAALKGYELVAKVLLAAGAPVNARMKTDVTREAAGFSYSIASGQTPLHSAVKAGYPALVELLLAKGAEVNIEDTQGRTPLSYAAQKRNDGMAKTLLAAGADPNAGHLDLPLHFAAWNGDIVLLELLLTKGAAPRTNSLNDWVARQPGMPAERSKATPLNLAIKNHQPEAVKLLVSFKADPNALDYQGNPSLIFDALSDIETLKALLDGGADPNLTNPDTASVLERATEFQNQPAIEALLAHSANPNLGIQKSAWTPLHAAAGRESKEIVELLLKSGAEVNAREAGGATPLHGAVQNGRRENVEVLLANKADPNARNNAGQTPLDLAKRNAAQAVPGMSFPGGLAPPPIPPGVPTRTLRIPGPGGGSVAGASASPEPASGPANITDLLRQHGATDELPDFSVIRVMRKGMGQWVVFKRDTNSFNRFTLFETLASASFIGLQFPDFGLIIIHRPDPAKPGAQKEISVNPMSSPGSFDCAKDQWLEFGDVVEIPEREHTLTASGSYLWGSALDSLKRCLARKVRFVVRDQSAELALEGSNAESYLSPALQRPTAQNILLSSSDFSRVHIKRTDPESKKTIEFTEDVRPLWAGKIPRTDGLWLRDGDVIEVPDKTE